MSEKLFKSTIVVSLMTFLSRILGFVRDIVIARMFGAGLGADVFFVAFKIPKIFYDVYSLKVHSHKHLYPYWQNINKEVTKT
jgi:putative peptidoglycan lipid II flippase